MPAEEAQRASPFLQPSRLDQVGQAVKQEVGAMADTMQVVRWALGQSCALRTTAEAAREPSEALAAIGKARTISRAMGRPFRGFGIYGDICVTGNTFASIEARSSNRKAPTWHYPCNGFVVSKELAGVGGLEGLVKMCRGCPANTESPRPAGCAGTIYQSPESPAVQEQFEGIIARLGLEVAMGEAFGVTTPLWYGFWIKSPVPRRGLEVMAPIFERMLQEDRAESEAAKPGSVRRDHIRELDSFVRALTMARDAELELRVSMAPPGHTDFGYYTVFPHCPVCKAEARLARWKRRYPTQLYTCQSCGNAYPPAETASSEKDDLDLPELRQMLGDERFREFAASYLMAQGVDARQAAQIVDGQERWDEQRRAKIASEHRQAERQEAYVQAVLYAGLHPLKEEADEEGALFGTEEFAEILRRCEARGITVVMMKHVSREEALDRAAWRRIGNPLDLFNKWRAEGCRERFGAVFRVADTVLGEFEAGQ